MNWLKSLLFENRWKKPVICRVRTCLLAAGCLISVQSFSASSGTSYGPNINTFESGASHTEVSFSENRGYLGLSGVSYVNPNYETEKHRNIPLYSGRIHRQSDLSHFSFGMDVEGQFSPEAPQINAFTVNELYGFTTMDWTENTIVFGRSQGSWSLLDQKLSLAVIEPSYSVDPMRSHTQGLTGVFINFEKPLFNFKVFASNVFLPNQGPSVEVQNGKFVEGHPWINLPPNEVMIKGVNTPAQYTVVQPELTEIIFQESYGAQIEFGDLGSEGFRSQLSYLNKPMNQLALGYDGQLTVLDSSAILDVTLHPEVVRHSLVAADLSYLRNNVQTYVSLIIDKPNDENFASRWTHQKFTPAQIFGGGFEVTFNNLGLIANYVHREEGVSKEIGRFAHSSSRVLPERFAFKDLLSLEGKVSWRYPRFDKNNIWVRWDQELSERSEGITFQLDHQFEKYLIVSLGFDLLKTNADFNDPTYSYLAKYASNDRFFGGFSYVF